jgi:membrane-bound lytic murein transglycosylase D
MADQPTAQPQTQAQSDNGDLYQTAKDLFDQYAPPDVKAQYAFPSKADFDRFLAQLQQTLDSGSFADMAAYEPQARGILEAIRTMPDYADMAGWLSARLDELDEAREIEEASHAAVQANPGPYAPAAPESSTPLAIPPVTGAPGMSAPVPSAASLDSEIPYYNRWVERLSHRPPPLSARELMPQLRQAFSEEGVPPELAWLAEVESSLNPSARSPAGARGLFQLKADTARGLGLSTFLPDERTDPRKSAHAAARDLRLLEEKFGSWPLAIAAYNAGAGRVSRAVASRHAEDYAGAASALPAGTRLYVPEVCAMIAVRTGITPDRIPPPR